ncbi:Putative protein in type-1 retrotransposable element R1DM [Araneus ventricosus]|uniref:Reverse transcriptase domain-containing protein n=1 Tax=Araneus ventricosus TaxID=182803 RepID=A0A4Y2RYQ7_ARAVE|nr:Putative protein in type-1 retrotransposable element R1DM [Araneus ventricosus]
MQRSTPALEGSACSAYEKMRNEHEYDERCLNLQYFPTKWKIGRIVLFHKKGKPKSETKSYRPVSLLPTLGKVVVKLFLERLNFHLTTNKLQADNQYGFTINKSYEEAIVDFIDKIGIARSTKSNPLVISLDIKGAFDHLQYNSIKNSLKDINFHSNTKETLLELLSGRQVALNTPQGPALLPQHRGCSQGSCTGPAYSNLVANEVLTQS